jgi:hypothetical protein
VSTAAPVGLPDNVKAVAKELLGRVEQLRREREEVEPLPQVVPDQVSDMPRFVFYVLMRCVNLKYCFTTSNIYL